MNELKQCTLLQGGKYIIKRVLGQGGFGITYLAEQVSLKREVAIKEFFMKDGCMRDGQIGSVTVPSTGASARVEQFRKKFFKEASSLAGLDHPHIISVIDVFEENGTVYYSMPYMPNGSLKSLVEKKGPMPEAEALRYANQVASALKYMHNRHLCHYDVKPDNILIDNRDNAVLIDFGISKNYDADGNETSTTPVGISEGYAPIEQYQGISGFSPASDVYALGATLYYLLEGKAPPSAILRVAGTKLTFSANVSGRTHSLIKQSMTLQQNRRPKDMSVFMEQKIKKPQMPYWIAATLALIAVIVLIVFKTSNNSVESAIVSDNHEVPEMLNVDSIFQVGYNYLKGELGYHQDYNAAVKHFSQAAEQGHVVAQYWLGRCLQEGWGVDKNDSIAANWYSKSANQGYADAQCYLGICYANGEGVEQNDSLAFNWCLRAANQGNAIAQTCIGNCYLWGDFVAQNEKEAYNWYRKAANQGFPGALSYVGICYERGYGVEENMQEAFEWYRKAAEQGDPDAQDRLGRFYEDGKVVTQDLNEAIKWYRKAAAQDYFFAKESLKRLDVTD